MQFPQLAAFTGGDGLIRVIGHRGARGVMPENTMEGFAFTLSCGVRLLEFDVVMSRDGVPVITHNHSLTGSIVRDRAGNWLQGAEPKVSDLDWANLAEMDVGGLDGSSDYGQRFPDQAFLFGARIPRLSDLCALIAQPGYQDVHLMLEIKSDPDKLKDASARAAVVAAVVAEVRALGLTARTLMHSFDWALLAECARQAPEMPTSFLTQLPQNAADIGEDHAAPAIPGLAEANASLPDLVAQAGGALWCPYYLDVTAAQVERAHALGLRVAVWTVNEVADIDQMIGLGIDAIVTDYPGRVQRRLLALGCSWTQQSAMAV
ncbi:glycerophosphodiester phosphodiesterase family protein [Pseudophaeobacter arcticus]|jgi:glycerophosphoryl diester phosphodiesterase|uniref:glycerophosphodiester phosphodiesterase family protein n=1 Tax=Pseudophaeobacter arcticus TaxID=385492 RepID=UPI0039E3AF5F